MSNKPIYVFIPACNEEEKIAEIINELRQLELDLKIHVIDDGSTDGTREKAREAGAFVIRHPTNLGQWAAMRTGFAIALIERAEIMVSIDADGQHDPRDLPNLVEPILEGTADIVVGSRFLDGEKQDMPTYRYFGIKMFNKLMKIMTKKGLTDCTSGYKAYRISMMRSVVPTLVENQYGALEFLMKAARHRIRILEKPIKAKPNDVSKKGKLKFGYNLLRTIIGQLF